MPDYSLGKIYKLHCILENDNEPLTYYGSTTEPYLSSRLAGHIRNYKTYLNGKINYYTSFKLFEKYRSENILITLIESYSCNSKDELEARERYYIQSNECVNKFIPTRSKKEYNKEYYQLNIEKIKKYQKEYNKEYNKEYYQSNIEKIKEQNKEYYQSNIEKYKEYNKEYQQINAEKIKENQKEYKQLNVEKIKEYQKEYKQLNIDKIKEYKKEIYTCNCGSNINNSNKSRHIKTTKHINYMNSII